MKRWFVGGRGADRYAAQQITMVSNIDFLNLHTFFDALVLMYRVTTRLAAEHHRSDDLEVIRARQAEFAAAVQAQDGWR